MSLPGPEISDDDRIDAFITRWAQSGAAERANFQLVASEMCQLLGVDQPEPTRADWLHGWSLRPTVSIAVMLRAICLIRASFRASHSQTIMTLHPRVLRSSNVFASRATLRASFGVQ